MKAFKILLLLLALGLSVHGQAVNVTANKLKGSATAPSGTCSAQQVQLTTAGTVYVCASGTWASSGGGTTINSTNGQVPYRVNSTTFGDSAFASNALNSTYLSATSGASGAGLTLTVAGGGSNESLLLAPKGTGQVFLGGRAELKDYTTPYNDPAVALSIDSNAKTYLFNMYSNGSWVLALHRTSGNFQLNTNGRYGWGSGVNTPDLGITRLSSGVARLDNGTTGAGRFLIGTSTDTADAQLSVYSQSPTRPSLKLNMPSGTSGSQEAFGVYDNGTLSYAIHTDGKIVYVSGNTGTTVGAAGGASALPATPTGYLQVVIGGTTYKIPYYAN